MSPLSRTDAGTFRAKSNGVRRKRIVGSNFNIAIYQPDLVTFGKALGRHVTAIARAGKNGDLVWTIHVGLEPHGDATAFAKVDLACGYLYERIGTETPCFATNTFHEFGWLVKELEHLVRWFDAVAID